jgi:diguanylate cyclase (GGDEF)-like protein
LKKTTFIALTILSVILIAAYALSLVSQSNFWGDLLSPMNAFLAAIFLLITFIRTGRRDFVNHALLFYSLACFFWGFADTLWLISDLIIPFPDDAAGFITFFYTLTNLCFLMGIAIFALYQFRRWNIAKLLLDIAIFSVAGIFLIWIVFFDRSNEILTILTIEGVFSVICIVIDLIIYTGISVWYLSIRNGNIPLYMRFMSTGIFAFALTDLYYYYIAYHQIYVVNSFIDAIYLVDMLIVGIGGLLFLTFYKSELIIAPHLTNNVGTRSKEFLILLCPIFVILIRGFVLSEFLIFISLTVIYFGLNTYFQSAIKNEDLLKKEMHINNELEAIIAERTHKLHQANTELTVKNAELHRLSNTDTLTSLYNRRYFLQTLENSIAGLEPGQTISLFYMDLDRFKLINDTYGHSMGDLVLKEISHRLAASVCSDATIARMGGDEFVLSCIGSSNAETAIEMAKKIIATCSQEIYINGYIFYPALCIGISIYPNDAKTAEMLMKNADVALYHAKSQGINHYAVYSAAIQNTTQKRNEIELFLRRNDFFKDLRLFYQPQFSIPDQKLTGVEALIRWVSAENQIMTPEEFIRIAEETDHINEIGIWVLKKAVLQIIQWNNQYHLDLKMGINISPKQLNSTDLLNELNQLGKNINFDPKWLDIEITESIAMDGEYRMSQIFNLFKSIGMSVSIDDFGTGYSSIAYLKHFTFDRIKIAKPLIDSVVINEKGQQIVQAIVFLAKSIGIKTIAEGVETKEQMEILSQLGCEQIQGFYLGRPVPAEEFEANFIKNYKKSDNA